MKHTPGPWYPTFNNRGVLALDEKGVFIEVAQSKTVHFVTGSGVHQITDEIAQNNNRLICAAPEMYDALEAIVAAVDDTYRDVWRNGDHDTQHYCPMCNETRGHGQDCPIPLVKNALKK